MSTPLCAHVEHCVISSLFLHNPYISFIVNSSVQTSSVEFARPSVSTNSNQALGQPHTLQLQSQLQSLVVRELLKYRKSTQSLASLKRGIIS